MRRSLVRMERAGTLYYAASTMYEPIIRLPVLANGRVCTVRACHGWGSPTVTMRSRGSAGPGMPGSPRQGRCLLNRWTNGGAGQGNILARPTRYDANITKAVLHACAAHKACWDEYERHVNMHEHCRICGEAGRRRETVCNELLASL